MHIPLSRHCPDNAQLVVTLPLRFKRPSIHSVIGCAPHLGPGHSSGKRVIVPRARGYGSETRDQDILQPYKEPGLSPSTGVQPQHAGQGDVDPSDEANPCEANPGRGKIRSAKVGSRNSGVRQGRSYIRGSQGHSHRDLSNQRSKGRNLRQVRTGGGRQGYGRRVQQKGDSGRRFVANHQESLWDMHGVKEVPSFDDNFAEFLSQHTDFSGDHIEVGGRQFDGPPAMPSETRARADSSAPPRQKRGPRFDLERGPQQDDVWGQGGNQRGGRGNHDRKRGRNGQNGWQNSRNSQRGRGGRGRGRGGRGDGTGRWQNGRGSQKRRGDRDRGRDSGDRTPVKELSPAQVGWKSAMESYRLAGLRKRQDEMYLKMIKALHPSPDRAGAESRLSVLQETSSEASENSKQSLRSETLQNGRIEPLSSLHVEGEDGSSWLDLDDDLGMYKADFARFMPDGDSSSLWDGSKSGGSVVPPLDAAAMVDDASDSWWLQDHGDTNASDTDGELDALLELLGGVDVIDEPEAESGQLNRGSGAWQEGASDSQEFSTNADRQEFDANADRQQVAIHASSTHFEEPLKVDHPRGNTSDTEAGVRWAQAWKGSKSLQPQVTNHIDEGRQDVEERVGGVAPPLVPQVKKPAIVVDSETGEVSLDGDILMDWIQEFPN